MGRIRIELPPGKERYHPKPIDYHFSFWITSNNIATTCGTIKPLLGVIREQEEWRPFRHKGAARKGQNSKRSREHENCNQGAGSTIFVSKRVAESKLGTNLDV